MRNSTISQVLLDSLHEHHLRSPHGRMKPLWVLMEGRSQVKLDLRNLTDWVKVADNLERDMLMRFYLVQPLEERQSREEDHCLLDQMEVQKCLHDCGQIQMH